MLLPELGWCPWWVAQRIHPQLLLPDLQERPGGTRRAVSSVEVSSMQMKSELATAMVTKSLKKPRTHSSHHYKVSLLQLGYSRSLLPVQGEDPNPPQLPIHLLLLVLYLDLPLQSLLQHLQSHLYGSGSGK